MWIVRWRSGLRRSGLHRLHNLEHQRDLPPPHYICFQVQAAQKPGLLKRQCVAQVVILASTCSPPHPHPPHDDADVNAHQLSPSPTTRRNSQVHLNFVFVYFPPSLLINKVHIFLLSQLWMFRMRDYTDVFQDPTLGPFTSLVHS